jgi:hypothetical protein
MAKKLSNAARIRNYMAAHPNAKPMDIADKLEISVSQIYVERNKIKLREKALKEQANTVTWQPPAMLPMPEVNTITIDPVNQPEHYKAGGIETIDFIEAKQLNYNLGNVVKYITRAELKGNRKQDLEKAMWYLKREIGA